jgi:hypothetical protein
VGGEHIWGNSTLEDNKNTFNVLPPRGVNNQEPSLDTRFSLYKLTRDENETAQILIQGDDGEYSQTRQIRMSPTHHINSTGELSGYRFTTSPEDSCACLPINREMFHGTSAVQCVNSAYDTGSVNLDAIRLLGDLPRVVEKMRALIAEITQEAADAVDNNTVATLDCAPVNADAIISVGDGPGHVSAAASATRAKDSKAWVAECPVSIGLYHAFARRFNNTRVHSLYVVVSGGCTTACDQYLNLKTDLAIDSETTAAELADSEESWWLRKLNCRMRARLMQKTAQKFELTIPTVHDVQSFNSDETIAATSIETLTHDITTLRNGRVAVLNNVVDTTTLRNGILCTLAPSDGLKLFKGPPVSNHTTQDMGGSFGRAEICGIFPTSCPRVSVRAYKHTTENGTPVTTEVGSSDVFVYANLDVQKSAQNASYIKFDETFHRNLDIMNYNRDNGVVELIPICVGVF